MLPPAPTGCACPAPLLLCCRAADEQASAASSGAADPQATYRQWLRRQYGAFTARLLEVLTSGQCSAAVQVRQCGRGLLGGQGGAPTWRRGGQQH